MLGPLAVLNPMRSSPDNFVWGDYRPYPFFMAYAASYSDRETDADVTFRDSIALAEVIKVTSHI